VCDLAVVALEEVLADDLPVRLELGFPPRVEDEVVDVEAELGDLCRHRSKCIRERLRLGGDVDEDERAPALDRHGLEPELALREVGLLLRPWRGPQRSVEPVRPRVVRTLQRLAPSFAFGDDEASMPADVHERAQHVVARARHDHGRAGCAAGEVRAGLRQPAAVADVLPRRSKDELLLAAEDLRIRVPAVGERVLHRV